MSRSTSLVLRELEDLMRSEPSLRFRVQVSAPSGAFLALLHDDCEGRPRPLWYGKGDSAKAAIAGLLEAASSRKGCIRDTDRSGRCYAHPAGCPAREGGAS